MSLSTKLYETITGISNYMSNPLSTSKFLEEGVLTPEEFVAAGDLLVMKTPSWSWQPGNPKNLQKGLPKDKHYLVTKNVPCLMRVSTLESKNAASENKEIDSDDGDGGWIATHMNETTAAEEDIPEIPTSNSESKKEEEITDSDEDVPEIDLASLSVGNLELEDPATLTNENIVRTRTYDLSICYDQYHQTPRVWLFGYDENGKVLKPEQVLEDISQDHVNKTVTIAQHPHTNIPQAYIHPCKHASVMKKIVQRMVESGKTLRVDQYLFLFLKFIHAAIPTIEYDHTFQVEL
eukprot:TRINITY_DN12772_c0_g1_i1.p1 TRINITY_DN12772_c0_g1~~TRINITY_DN12772_c0_g1_i1.p1  ORF type:complete len:292 (+),score=86.07 TRINITY_DN12772_c0_g1_i1:171-1046(+)